MADLGKIEIRVTSDGVSLIKADRKGLGTLLTIIEGARAHGWSSIDDEKTGQRKLRIERIGR